MVYYEKVIFVFGDLSTFFLQAQTLDNTFWKVFDTNGVFLYNFQFKSDTVFFKDTPSNPYQAISTYWENGSSFKILDLPVTTSCDTGFYSFTLNSGEDTLVFTLIKDTCFTRPDIFIDYTWVDMFTSILGLKDTRYNIEIYPNSVVRFINLDIRELNHNITFSIFNQFGKIVKRGVLKNQENRIDLVELENGFYFLKFEKESNQSIKFLKLK